MGKRCFSRIRCSRLFRQFLLADDFARRLNFSGLEASGSARVAIELRIDSRGSSELLAINRQAETDGESSGSETCGEGKTYYRWCFSDPPTARAFFEQFGGSLHEPNR
jgi:hypothetical protein